jgi:hypothetical protein
MAWVKRNLFFLAGGVIALLLLGAAVLFNLKNYKLNEENRDKLKAEYDQLEQLNHQNPHPGNEHVDNIAAAKSQNEQVKAFIGKAGGFFEVIPPSPAGTNVTDESFAAELRRTIELLQRDAALASVTLPPRYDFSFGAIKSKITFATGSLPPLAGQLGEVKTICGILFSAKVNALDAIRRERVSLDDKEAADYIEMHSVTNEMAIITPYQVTFRCFSTELATVLAGFSNSKHCFIVKTVSVEPGSIMTVDSGVPGAPMAFAPAPVARVMDEEGGTVRPTAAPVAAPSGAGARGGFPTVLNERLLKVDMLLEVVKLNKPTQ